MKYFISLSILLFVSFTASAQAKKSKQELKKETSVTTNLNSKKDYRYQGIIYYPKVLISAAIGW